MVISKKFNIFDNKIFFIVVSGQRSMHVTES